MYSNGFVGMGGSFEDHHRSSTAHSLVKMGAGWRTGTTHRPENTRRAGGSKGKAVAIAFMVYILVSLRCSECQGPMRYSAYALPQDTILIARARIRSNTESDFELDCLPPRPAVVYSLAACAGPGCGG